MKRRRLWQRFLFASGYKLELLGVPVSIWRLSTPEERAVAIEKLRAGLRLIEKTAPRRLEQIRSDVGCILVAGDPTFVARFVDELKLVEFYEAYVVDGGTTAAMVACTLVHEAQHARLCRLGFGYEEPIRGKVERICFRAERNFARLLPGEDALVNQAQAWMDADSGAHYSNEAQRQAYISALRALGFPPFLVKTADWVSTRRARWQRARRRLR